MTPDHLLRRVPRYRRRFRKRQFLVGVCSASLLTAPLAAEDEQAQPVPDLPDSDIEIGVSAGTEDDGIVVQGQRLRGQLLVEQAPLLELNEDDIAGEGVTSIADLVTQISNQTGSARGRGGGGRPVILVNGIRIGSFRELASYPPEALAKVEVFPEEVAQRFGFPPNRRVINLILKENYSSREIELEFEGPTRGGYLALEQELGYLQIADGGRLNVNFEARDVSLLTEAERDVIQTDGSVSDVAGDPDQAEFRSLVSDTFTLEGNLSWAKALIDSGTSLSANLNYDRNESRGLNGLNVVTLTDAAGNSAFRTFGEDTPLETRTSTDTLSAAGSLTRPIGAFRLTATADASLVESETEIDQRFDTAGLQADALAGLLPIDGALPSSADAGFATARTRSINATSKATVRGTLLNLPAGEVRTTFDLGYSWNRIQSSDTRTLQEVELTRGDLEAGVNLNIPLTSTRNGFADAIGSFTLNLNAGVDELSDFGTLNDWTAGLTWSPFGNLDLSATYIWREVAPSLAQLGNPQVETLNAPVFDFVTGQTVLATVTTGGNPNLLAETQADWRFAANWELPFWSNTRFTAEYIRNRSDDVTASFPVLTDEIEAAFPDRVTRDASGTLTAIDRRPITFAETRSNRLQFSLFTRGSWGGPRRGQGGGQAGGGRGGPARSAGRPPPQAASAPAAMQPAASAQTGAPPGRGAGGPPNPERMAQMMQFREQICADDGLEVLSRLAEAAAKGEDLSAIVPGAGARRIARMLSRVLDDNGEVDPERLALARERICSFDPATMRGPGRGRGGPPGGPPSGPPGQNGERPEGFAAFRALVCAEDGEARLRALIARIDAGEDVSDEVPGFDLNMASMMIDRLRGDDGTISSERIAQLRGRFCEAEGSGQAGQGGQAGRGGQGGRPGGPGFNPLRSNFGRDGTGRYFMNLTHTVELDNEILVAPGGPRLDLLDGDATGAFGQARHSVRLEGGIFRNGMGLRVSGRYSGPSRIDGTGQPGSTDLFFGDLVTLDLRFFGDIGRLVGKEEGFLKNLRFALRADNVFDTRREVRDASGSTPINYQPFVIDPIGRFVGIDIRKIF